MRGGLYPSQRMSSLYGPGQEFLTDGISLPVPKRLMHFVTLPSAFGAVAIASMTLGIAETTSAEQDSPVSCQSPLSQRSSLWLRQISAPFEYSLFSKMHFFSVFLLCSAANARVGEIRSRR